MISTLARTARHCLPALAALALGCATSPSREPPDPFLAVRSGAWEARIHEASGRVELVGPGGGAGGVSLAPSRASVGEKWRTIGRVLRSAPIERGLALTQEFGDATVEARLRFVGEATLRYEVLAWGATPTAVVVSAASAADEHFYGFGEKFDSVDQAGRRLRMATSDRASEKGGGRSYKVAPWFMSTRGYGFHLDSPAKSIFDMRKTEPDRWVVENPAPALAVHLVGGPRLADVLSRYTALVGRPPLPPPWVFAPWISSDIWRTGGEVRYVVERLREAAIPHSVFVFDSPWATAYNDFTWNAAQFGAGGTYEGKSYDGFASPREMLAFLRRNGFKVVLWMTPFVDVASSEDEGVPGLGPGRARNYDEAARAGWFVRSERDGSPLLVKWWKGTGSPIDFTSAGAREWVARQLRALVEEGGGAIGGFKTDDGEGNYVPLRAWYSDGRTGAEMQNAYAVEYHRAISSVLGREGVLLARSGFPGSQACPGCWSGDNEPNFGEESGLPSVIAAGLSAAMSGWAIWGHDIGGYFDVNPSPSPASLFMRWTQVGAFSPIMLMHRKTTAGRQYPWSYGRAALENYAFHARLHAKLFPYLYTCAKRASEEGLPILRPLVFAHQDDPGTFAVKDEYFFGDALLVAPILEEDATGREVYLPKGAFHDFWTSERFEGGRRVAWKSADPMRFPLFVREGAIVPMLRDPVQTLCDPGYAAPDVATATDALEIAIYPAPGATFTTYDGTRVDVASRPDGLAVTVTGRARPILLRVFSSVPRAVSRDGEALPWTTERGFAQVDVPPRDGASVILIQR